MLNKISWSLSFGYGRTNYTHDLNGFYFYQDTASQFITPIRPEGLGELITGSTGWFNDPGVSAEVDIVEDYDVPFALPQPVFNPSLSPNRLLLNADTANLGFEGFGSGIPVLLSAHYDYRNFRFGLGWSYEKHWIKPLVPTSYSNVVRNYRPNFKSTRYTRIFGLLGYRFYEYWDYSFVGELQVGRMGYGPQFNKGALSRGMYFNLGISFEHNWSQYFRIVVRPSYDIKKYTINLPDGSSVLHNQNTFMIMAGVSINIPEIPRSPMKSDHVQLKHVITDPNTGRLIEVRGQSIFKKQNPKVGENHRKLLRYKFRNRKKLNPY